MEKPKTTQEVFAVFQQASAKVSNFDSEITSNLVLLDKHDNFPQISKDNNKEILFKLPVLQNFTNSMRNIHGGAVGTIVDICTTVVLLINDKFSRLSVSTHLSVNYLLGISEGNDIYILCKMNKMGKNIGFTTCEIYNKDKKLLYTGSHNKAFINGQSIFELLPKL